MFIMHLLCSRHTVLATREGIASCPHGSHNLLREITIDKTNEKICNMLNRNIEQGKERERESVSESVGVFGH